jgi:hypothetical protein
VHVFQRTPNYSMSARNRPLPPGELHEVVRGYGQRRRAAQESDAGVPVAPPERSALSVGPQERRRMYEAGWQRGGINALSYAFNDITDCLGYLESRGLDCIEASPGAEQTWGDHVSELADATLYPQAASWYVGANIPGRPRVFMPYVGGCGPYRRECEEVVERGYEGFVLGKER